jgi:hypothetical protein
MGYDAIAFDRAPEFRVHLSIVVEIGVAQIEMRFGAASRAS